MRLRPPEMGGRSGMREELKGYGDGFTVGCEVGAGAGWLDVCGAGEVLLGLVVPNQCRKVKPPKIRNRTTRMAINSTATAAGPPSLPPSTYSPPAALGP